MFKLFFESLINTFLAMAPYMMFGLFFVGLLKVYVNKSLVLKTLGKDNFASVVKASLIGVPLPLCSCGVIPTAVELKKDGASDSAVSSFLISTPQTGIDSIAATYALMGPFFAIYRPIAAFLAGIFGGIVVKIFNRHPEEIKLNEEISEASCSCEHEHDKEESSCSCGDKCTNCEELEQKKGFKRFLGLFSYAYGDFLDEIGKDFAIGIVIAALIATFLPPSIFVDAGLDHGILAMLIMVVIGLPMYVCSTSSIPIAISLMLKGLSPGAAFVFLFAGPVTNAASIIILKKVLGKKTTVLYISSVIIFSLVGGLFLDFLVTRFGLSVFNSAITSQAAGMENGIISIVLSIIFLLLLLKGFSKKLYKARK